MVAPNPLPDLRWLSSVLAYNPETGALTWIDAPHLNAGARKVLVGRVAGTSAPGRYTQVRIRGKYYSAHRIAFKLMMGREADEIDHIDGNKSNNKWSNLRECTHGQNVAWGSGARARMGFTRHKSGKYQAAIQIDGKKRHLGLFDTPDEAARAYSLAARAAFGAFARLPR